MFSGVSSAANVLPYAPKDWLLLYRAHVHRWAHSAYTALGHCKSKIGRVGCARVTALLRNWGLNNALGSGVRSFASRQMVS